MTLYYETTEASARIIHQYRRPDQVNAYCVGTSVASEVGRTKRSAVPAFRNRVYAVPAVFATSAYMNNPG
jgi:hypothetical protein